MFFKRFVWLMAVLAAMALALMACASEPPDAASRELPRFAWVCRGRLCAGRCGR